MYLRITIDRKETLGAADIPEMFIAFYQVLHTFHHPHLAVWFRCLEIYRLSDRFGFFVLCLGLGWSEACKGLSWVSNWFLRSF